MSSLKALVALANSQQSPGQSIGVDVIAKVAPDVDALRMEADPDDKDGWVFEEAAGLDAVEHVVSSGFFEIFKSFVK